MLESFAKIQNYRQKVHIGANIPAYFYAFLEGTLEEWGQLLHSLRHIDVVHGDMGGTFYKVQRLVFCTGSAVDSKGWVRNCSTR